MTMPDTESTITRSPDQGLIGWLEDTRVALPLKGVEARFEVAGEVAHVELDQIYHQTAKKPLDCLYTFPLPAEAAVHRCEFHVNGRVISARVEELQKAHELYDTARQAGQRAALMESERPNLFTLNLANVQPDDLVVVRLAYVQVLERIGNERRLRIPFCPGIRYVPGQPLLRPNQSLGTTDDTDQVPDASRISPPRIDALHPDAAYLSIQGSLQANWGDFRETPTSSHPIKVHQTPPTPISIELNRAAAVPDQDFLLRWELNPAVALESRAWTADRTDWKYSLIELRAPAELAKTKREPVDVYFLLDRSGSMAGMKWTKACSALDHLLRRLQPNDRTQVTWFSDSHGALTPTLVAADAFSREWPAQRIESLGTLGGTELLPALNQVLFDLGKVSEGRKPVLVLITDGQVGNEQAVAEAMQAHPRLVLHAFGIDTTVNDALLTQLARQQRGGCFLLRPDEDIPAAVGRLGDLLSQPVVTDLQAPTGWESADGPLPDLYIGQTATAVLRGRGEAPRSLNGRTPNGQETLLPLAIQTTESPAIPLLWAQRRIASLEAQRHFAEALPLAQEFNLICTGAAFVAWDNVEKVAIANDRIYQPSFAPASWVSNRSIRRNRIAGAIWDGAVGFMAVEDPGAGRYAAPVKGFRSISPDQQPTRPPWAKGPMFQEPNADAVIKLLCDWLTGLPRNQRMTATHRLEKLIANVLATTPATASKQLKELVAHLGDLFGSLGPMHTRWEQLQRDFGIQNPA